jgi:hypothetical protein
VGNLGAIMVNIMEAQAESSLRLHKNLLKNIRATGAAVGATGSTRDARLSEAKLRILQACAGQDDSLPFTPSKLYLEVDQEGGTTDTFSCVLCRLVVMVPGSPHKCNVHIPAKIVSAAKTLNFSAYEDLTFDGCFNGITPFAVPWRTADANNTNLAEEQYFNEATLKSPQISGDTSRAPSLSPHSPYRALCEYSQTTFGY